MMTRLKVLSCFYLFIFCYTGLTYSQATYDLYLFSLHQTPDGKHHIYNPKFLSSFNKGGITYQPGFTPDGNLLVSVRKAGELQNDIWQLSLSAKKIKRLTNTKASEFLPQMNHHGQSLSFLKKEQGSSVDQQVMNIDLKSQKMYSLTGDIHDVSNYAWMSDHELGLYRVDNSLTYLEINNNKSRRVTTSVSKSISADEKGRLVYVHKFDQDFYYIKKYDPSSSLIDVVALTPSKAEDFNVAPDGTIFMWKDQILYSMNSSQKTSWDEVADLSLYNIHFITGLCISGDGQYLALVATKVKP